jgi:hypothetical protein
MPLSQRFDVLQIRIIGYIYLKKLLVHTVVKYMHLPKFSICV